MSFRSIIGHERAVRILHNQLTSGCIPGGYLFCGPRGIGKATTAFSLARALQCSAGGDDGCNVCRRIDERNFPDVEYIDYNWQLIIETSENGKKNVKEKKKLGIQAIQTIRGRVSLKPMEGTWKIFIIDRADTMTTDAANCFLKILEEPPPHTVFVLVAEREKNILPTIRSRCQLIRFGFLSRGECIKVLEKNHNTQTVLYDLFDGSPGKALEFGREGLERLKEIQPLWDMIESDNMAGVLTLAQDEYDTNEEIQYLMELLMLEIKKRFKQSAKDWNHPMHIVLKSLRHLRVYANARLVRDVALIHLTRSIPCRSL